MISSLLLKHAQLINVQKLPFIKKELRSFKTYGNAVQLSQIKNFINFKKIF